MQLNKLIQRDYTSFSPYYQLKLPLDIEISIPSDDPVRLVSAFVEEMDLSELYKTYSRIRKNQATPCQMLKLVIYAAMNRIYSSRDIRKACKRDINFMYLLEGMPAPDHATIARFISLHFAVCAKALLAQMSDLFYLLGEISGQTIFIVGTKIESAANKYTLDVKFVAIQERVDTETGEGTEMMPFHNIFNEWYAVQTSKKVRAVWAMKAANGKRSNFRVPYGYKRDELDKEKWLVDEAAAEVVRRIYHLCLEGKGPEQIARLLQKEKVLTPTAYYYSVGSSSANRPMPSDPYLWKDSTIDAILSNRKYTGCMVNLKTTTVSYKVHKLICKPEEEWSIVPNAQEAIVDENTWNRVQELRKNKRRPTATGKTSLFSGLVFCADCGSKLHFCAAKSLKANQDFFRCANYKSGRGECTIHYIRNVALEQIVSVAVSDLADFVTCHESFFLQMIGKRQSAGKDQNIRSVKSDIANEKHRIDEIDRLIAKLYEDNFAGKLSDERYSRMAAKYEKEQAELLQSVSTKEKELAELERESVDIRLLLAGLREYFSMETLTPEVVNKIIKRMEVHNSEMVNGHKRVCIDIHFTGVGLVDLATSYKKILPYERKRLSLRCCFL